MRRRSARPPASGGPPWSVLVALSFAVAGCSETREELRFLRMPELPDRITHVAAIAEDEARTILATTPLKRLDDGIALGFDGLREDGPILIELIGYDDDALRAMGSPDPEVSSRSSLRLRSGCEPALPEPGYRLRFYSNGELASDDAPARSLTTEWLSAVCPDVSQELAVDVRCQIFQCPLLTTQRDCTLVLDLVNCNEGRYEARVDWAGNLCGEASSRSECSFLEPEDTAVARIECGMPELCRIDVHSRARAPRLVVDSIQVVPGAPIRAPDEINDLSLRAWGPLSGYIADLEATEERLIVATRDGGYQESWHCNVRGPGRLVFLDRTTLAETASSTTPPCLSRIIAAPGGGVYGVFGAASEVQVGLFDDRGRLVRSRLLELPAREGRSYHVTNALRLDRTGELAILFQWDATVPVSPDDGSLVAAVDLGTFATRVLWDGPDDVAFGFTQTDDGLLAVTSDELDHIAFVDTVRGGEVGGRVEVIHLWSVSVGAIMFLPDRRRFLTVSPYEEPVVWVLTDREVVGSASFFEEEAGPVSLGAWPYDEDLVLIGAGYNAFGPVRDAWLALFDPDVPRFLPGAVRAGYGVVGKILSSGGEVFVTLPWEGSIARITPR